MSHRLRILHLSDLHERVTLDWMDQKRQKRIRAGAAARHRVLVGKFKTALADVARSPIDPICFTGDVADWGLAEEYERATDRFKAISSVTGVPFERFFLVPGNHDVQRKTNKAAWRRLRTLAASHDQYIALSKWMASLDAPRGVAKDLCDRILERQKAFRAWLSGSLGRPEQCPESDTLGTLGYSVPLTSPARWPFPIRIIGLDSAWLSGDDNDAGKLLLTKHQLDLLARDEEGKPFSGFRLVLIHHPLSDLADHHECERLLADSTDLLLHGHQHVPIAAEANDLDRSFRMLAAGCLYEGDTEDRWPNAFRVIDVALTDQGRPLHYDLEFWGWSPRSNNNTRKPDAGCHPTRSSPNPLEDIGYPRARLRFGQPYDHGSPPSDTTEHAQDQSTPKQHSHSSR